jgi:magnesium transporter
LIDDITDAFGPLIQNIEYEVDSIDELVLILKEAEQSDMLRRWAWASFYGFPPSPRWPIRPSLCSPPRSRRIGTCRKKVMGLLRLMGNKADVVKGLSKRCNENWSVAPKSDIVRVSSGPAPRWGPVSSGTPHWLRFYLPQGLYLSDIQDHITTSTQNLTHYEKILSRSHSNYLAQISIEM